MYIVIDGPDSNPINVNSVSAGFGYSIGVKLQLNDGAIYENATIFLEENVVWISELLNGEVSNTYYDWEKITSIRTISREEK